MTFSRHLGNFSRKRWNARNLATRPEEQPKNILLKENLNVIFHHSVTCQGISGGRPPPISDKSTDICAQKTVETGEKIVHK
jgi:hypothetical protein